MDKKSKLIYGIIIALAFGLLAFAVITSLYKNKGQKIDDGGVMVSNSAETIETIYFDKELLEWRDEYGPCLTCTPENGFSKDGFVLMEPEKSARLCYGKKEKTGLGFNHKEDEGLYNYYFLELIRKENLIRGNVESYPYGTDSSRATFEGVYDEEIFEALVLGEFSAEGDTWQEEQTLRFVENGVQSLFSQTKEDGNGVFRIIPGFEKNLGFTFPQISCDEFDVLQQESGYADVMDSISNNDQKTFTGKITDIENGKDGYTVVLQGTNKEKVKTTLSIPNLGPDSDFDFSGVKIGNIISVSGESFTLGDDLYITASSAKLVEAEKNETQSSQKQDYVGLTEKEAISLAQKNKTPFRVVMRDGKPLPVTKDYRPGRINATVEKGIVVAYYPEGMRDLIKKEDIKGDKKPEKNDFIGLSESEAQKLADKHNILFRVIKEDGVDLGMTLDFRPGRMNAELKNGKVVHIDIEGGDDPVLLAPVDFEECLNTGGIIMESYPRQCQSGDKVFVEDISIKNKNVEKIFNLGPEKVECVGAFPQECYIVNGELFYDGIQGFDFESGYEYILQVEERPRCDLNKPETCPLDVGLNSYHLVDILEKTKK